MTFYNRDNSAIIVRYNDPKTYRAKKIIHKKVTKQPSTMGKYPYCQTSFLWPLNLEICATITI
jgi:hypothetical protein